MSHTRYTGESTQKKLDLPVQLYDENGNLSSTLQHTLNSHAEPQTTEVPDEAEILLNTEGYASDSDLPSDPVDSESSSLNYRSHSHQTWPTRTDQTLLPLQSSSVNSIQTHEYLQ